MGTQSCTSRKELAKPGESSESSCSPITMRVWPWMTADEGALSRENRIPAAESTLEWQLWKQKPYVKSYTHLMQKTWQTKINILPCRPPSNSTNNPLFYHVIRFWRESGVFLGISLYIYLVMYLYLLWNWIILYLLFHILLLKLSTAMNIISFWKIFFPNMIS